VGALQRRWRGRRRDALSTGGRRAAGPAAYGPEALLGRGGRCEDALRVGTVTPACLAPLKARWGRFLTVAQRPGVDPIDLDIALRRVGESYQHARRDCP
jgi:hypothetical protein